MQAERRGHLLESRHARGRFGGRRTIQTQLGGGLGGILDRDVIHDHVAVEQVAQRRAQLRIGRNEKAVRLGPNQHVGDHPALRGQHRRATAGPVGQRGHIGRHHALQKPHAVGAAQKQAPARR